MAMTYKSLFSWICSNDSRKYSNQIYSI